MAYSSSNIFANGLADLGANNWNNPYYNAYMTGGSGLGSGLGGGLNFGDQGFLTPEYASYMQGGQQGSPHGSTPYDAGSLIPKTPGGNDWLYPGQGSNPTGPQTIKTPDPIMPNYGGAGSGYPPGYAPGSSGGSGIGSMPGGLGGVNLNWNPQDARGDRSGIPSQNTGFNPWAGNPYAGQMANQMWQGFLQNGTVAGQTGAAIWETMKYNIGNMQANEQNRALLDVTREQLANQRAQYEALAAEASRKNDLESQRMANEMQKQANEIALREKELADQRAQFDAKLAAETALGNRQYDIAADKNKLDYDAFLKDVDAKIQAATINANAQNYGQVPGQSQLDFDRWKFEQEQKMRADEQAMKLGLFDKILGSFPNFGGTGGSGGGGGFGGGGFPGSGPGGGGTNFGPGGGGGYMPITAGALPTTQLRAGISAIEGSPNGGAYRPTGPGITNAQSSVLGQDYGAQVYAGGLTAANDALRQFLPQNAQLGQDALSANAANNLGWGQLAAEKERNARSTQLGQYGSMYELLMGLLG